MKSATDTPGFRAQAVKLVLAQGLKLESRSRSVAGELGGCRAAKRGTYPAAPPGMLSSLILVISLTDDFISYAPKLPKVPDALQQSIGESIGSAMTGRRQAGAARRESTVLEKMLCEPIPKMNIRKAATGDLERIVELLAQLGYANEVEQVGRYLHELRQSSSGEVFVAQDSENVVGVAVVHTIKPLHVRGTWALLSALVVDDERRSSRVGASLLIAAEGFALQHGCSQLELSSSSARTRAHLFYERNGYQEKRLRFVKILA